jgi:hypothetical protein
MTHFLIQVSGHATAEKADPRYIEGTKGDRFCDEPLRYGEYFNASPFWQRDGFGRHDAWQTIGPGDEGLLYCTGSVDEHGACLSHLLTVETVSLDDVEGARLEFESLQELVPKISYSDIQQEIEAGRFSEQMGYCGQEGFNITQIPATDIERVRELTRTANPDPKPADSHPDESLEQIAEDYFGDSSDE